MLDQTPDTLRGRTAESSEKLIRASLTSLRKAVAQGFDDGSIEEVLKESEVLSTALKRLESYLPDQPDNAIPQPRLSGPKIDVKRLVPVLSAICKGRTCQRCGLLKP